MDPRQEQVEKDLLERGRYEARGKYAGGDIRSEVVAGFEIPARAIFDARLNLTALSQILAR